MFITLSSPLIGGAHCGCACLLAWWQEPWGVTVTTHRKVSLSPAKLRPFLLPFCLFIIQPAAVPAHLSALHFPQPPTYRSTTFCAVWPPHFIKSSLLAHPFLHKSAATDQNTYTAAEDMKSKQTVGWFSFTRVDGVS